MDGASENWQAISDRQRAAQSSNASSFFITIPFLITFIILKPRRKSNRKNFLKIRIIPIDKQKRICYDLGVNKNDS